MSAYYNEIDPYAAQWLRNLIAAGHIAPGDVDTRSITEVQADDLRGYEQCHFFAGIGGWSYALRLAGWPDAGPVWTGSCPCQPFSVAGKQRGSDDERHLWPAFFDLIRKRRPGKVFGEQVAGAAGLAWLDHVCADLEGAGYAAAAADLCAAGVGAPHIRQRLYWVARADVRHASAEGLQRGGQHGQQPAHGGAGALAYSEAPRRGEQRQHGLRQDGDAQPGLDADGCGAPDPLDDPEREGLEGHRPDQGQGGRIGATGSTTETGVLGFWLGCDWIECSDGKARPTQPGLLPLAHGIPARVGRLRAYGNAIVPQVAAAFIRAAA